MKSTWTRLKRAHFKGKLRIPWAEREINEYIHNLEEQDPGLAQKLQKTPFVKFQGSPHESAKTKDPWHVSAALRKKEDFKGSGVSLHVYPDGMVVPSKAEFPSYQTTPATAEEIGLENAQWLDPNFVRSWQETLPTDDRTSKGKGKGKAGPSTHSSKPHKPHKPHKSSRGSGPSGGGSSSGKGKETDYNPYSMDPDTGVLYRYAENGVVVYFDPSTQSEYYYDENNEAVRL